MAKTTPLTLLVTLLSVLGLTGFLGGAGQETAAAATIDPELREAFAARTLDSKLDVAVILDEPFDFEAMDRQLQGLPPAERRARAIAALKEHARTVQSPVARVLEERTASGEVEDVRFLWSANVVAFRGGRGVVEALGATEVHAWVTENRLHDMFERATRPESGAEAPAETLRADPANPVNAWNVDWVNVPAAWDLGYDGTGVLVGHFDSGATLDHPDLAKRIWVNEGEIPGNGIDDDGNGYVDDVNGWDFGDRDPDPSDDAAIELGGNHGTHTAGTVCGDGTSGIRTGAAPGATIIVCKVTRSASGGAPFSAMWEAHQYALEQGAQILTQSMGLAGYVHESFLRAGRYDSEATRLVGAIHFNSAGNSQGAELPPLILASSARPPSPWARDPSVPYHSRAGTVTVGGTAYRSDATFFASSNGPADWSDVYPWNDWPYFPEPGLIKPDIVAPGEGIQSLLRPEGYTAEDWSGTSMACPLAAGVAALLLQKNPLLSPEDIDRILQQTAVPLGPRGKDNTFGSGRIDAFEAVKATPLSAAPYLVIEDWTLADASGDGYVESGESFDLIVTLANNSPAVDATGVTGTVTILGTPPVELVEGDLVFGDVAHGQSVVASSGRASFAAGEGTLDDQRLRVRIALVAEGGYAKNIEHEVFLGLPEIREHANGRLHLTVTDRGTLGFWDIFQERGAGFGPYGEWGGLFVGGFWGGNDGWYVCNRDLTPNDAAEWTVRAEPSGRVALAGRAVSDQDLVAVFHDGLHEEPRGIEVTQRSMVWTDTENQEFAILRYTIENRGDAPVEDYYAGLFCDWDVGDDPLVDTGGVDHDRRMVYVTGEGTDAHYGMMAIGDTPASNVTLIPNPTWVWPYGMIVDTNKWILLQGNRTFADGSEAMDYSSLVSAGPFDLAVGESVTVEFALLYGDDLADIRSNADAAAALDLSFPVSIGGGPTPPAPGALRTALRQNVPNPFNPSTAIAFEIAEPGPVRLAIYDLKGRLVRSLVSGHRDAGAHAVDWNGLDEAGRPVASGMYLYRLETTGRALTRKMLLVK